MLSQNIFEFCHFDEHRSKFLVKAFALMEIILNYYIYNNNNLFKVDHMILDIIQLVVFIITKNSLHCFLFAVLFYILFYQEYELSC